MPELEQEEYMSLGGYVSKYNNNKQGFDFSIR